MIKKNPINIPLTGRSSSSSQWNLWKRSAPSFLRRGDNCIECVTSVCCASPLGLDTNSGTFRPTSPSSHATHYPREIEARSYLEIVDHMLFRRELLIYEEPGQSFLSFLFLYLHLCNIPFVSHPVLDTRHHEVSLFTRCHWQCRRKYYEYWTWKVCWWKRGEGERKRETYG